MEKSAAAQERTSGASVQGKGSCKSPVSSRPVSPERNPMQEPPHNVVKFEDNDPANPHNWTQRKKTIVLITGLLSVMNSTLGSSLPSNASGALGETFSITDPKVLTLPITCYLIGYVVGPLLFGPLSEFIGRRPVMIWTFVLFFIFTLACAVAPTFAALAIFRLLTGVFASSPTAVIGGLYADIYAGPVARGRALSGFMAATTLGPVLGPIISGYASTRYGWRWVFWIGVIIAASTLLPILLLPETFAPVLLTQKAKGLRRNGQDTAISPQELNPIRPRDVANKVLSRPLRMIVSEWIVLFTCLYLSLIYSIFYLFFEAFPIIFEGIHHLGPGPSGLAFIPIGIGALLSFGIFIIYDGIVRRAQNANKEWIKFPEMRRLPLACVGGPLYAGAIFWLGWTASPNIHFIVPILAGLPFGIGFLLIFMALINYMADAYGIYAASALAAASTSRSLCGAVLPLATQSMYGTLGVHWATSLLGFLSLGMCAIPWGFIRFGDKLRERSTFAQKLASEKT